LHSRFSRPSWVHRYPVPKASAFLTFLSDSEETAPPAPIPLTGSEVTIGRDPIRATVVLDDPTVETLHARLRQEDGAYRLADEGSIAGTWVNYTQIPQEGVCLEHGDLIHIGRLGFRFSLRQPIHIRKPVVIPQETYL
jgi:predicted component of type VI protein secretion system